MMIKNNKNGRSITILYYLRVFSTASDPNILSLSENIIFKNVFYFHDVNDIKQLSGVQVAISDGRNNN